MKKNKYCPISEPKHKHAPECDCCEALNRQREDMEKEIKEEIVSKYGDFRPILKWGLGLVKYGRTLRFYLLPHTKHTEEDNESTI